MVRLVDQIVRGVLVLRLRAPDLVLGRLVLLTVQLKPLVILVALGNHHSFHVMLLIADESHLLGVQGLFLGYFARLDCQALGWDVNCTTCTCMVAHVGLACHATLGGLLLSDAHVFGLHHVGGHAQCF